MTPYKTYITGSDPDTCDTADSHRDTMDLKGSFPAIDKHGTLLIVTRSGNKPIALAFDPKGQTVPSFSYGQDARHDITIVYDPIAWCTGKGSLTFELALGGVMSNVYTMQVDSTDD